MMNRDNGSEGDGLSELHELNVTPFIDVMLVLLIVFMVAAPLATADIAVDLPPIGATAQPRPDKPIFLTLRADRTLAIADTPVTPDHLNAALDAATGTDKTRRIFLRGDKSVPYDAVMRTLDALRQAGYLRIGLVGLDVPTAP
jgi:biopolymer transport protein ExbD